MAGELRGAESRGGLKAAKLRSCSDSDDVSSSKSSLYSSSDCVLLRLISYPDIVAPTGYWGAGDLVGWEDDMCYLFRPCP